VRYWLPRIGMIRTNLIAPFDDDEGEGVGIVIRWSGLHVEFIIGGIR